MLWRDDIFARKPHRANTLALRQRGACAPGHGRGLLDALTLALVVSSSVITLESG